MVCPLSRGFQRMGGRIESSEMRGSMLHILGGSRFGLFVVYFFFTQCGIKLPLGVQCSKYGWRPKVEIQQPARDSAPQEKKGGMPNNPKNTQILLIWTPGFLEYYIFFPLQILFEIFSFCDAEDVLTEALLYKKKTYFFPRRSGIEKGGGYSLITCRRRFPSPPCQGVLWHTRQCRWLAEIPFLPLQSIERERDSPIQP